MYRWIAILVPLIFWRRILKLFVHEATNDGSHSPDGRVGLFAPLMQHLAASLGFEEIDAELIAALVGATMFLATVLGWMFYLILDKRSFNRFLNAIVAFLGIVGSAILWLDYGPQEGEQTSNLLIVAVFGGTAALVMSAFFKVFFVEGVDRFLSNPGSPRISRTERSTSRIDAVTRRRPY